MDGIHVLVLGSSTMKDVNHRTHEQCSRARIYAELVLDEFRQESGEPSDEQTLAGPREIQEKERRVSDEAAKRAR